MNDQPNKKVQRYDRNARCDDNGNYVAFRDYVHELNRAEAAEQRVREVEAAQDESLGLLAVLLPWARRARRMPFNVAVAVRQYDAAKESPLIQVNLADAREAIAKDAAEQESGNG